MFDVSFGELALIGLVALVVLGPERLPKVARTAGHLLGRLQRYVSDVKADINREMQLEELKKLQSQMQQSAQDMQSSVSSEMRALEETLAQTAQDAQAIVIPPEEAGAGTTGTPTAAPTVAEAPAIPAPSLASAAEPVPPPAVPAQGQQLELAIEPPKEKV